MTETAPRPWTAKKSRMLSSGEWIVEGAGCVLATFEEPYAEAHARMFAAGPEIADALEHALRWADLTGFNENYWVDEARAARAKLTKMPDDELRKNLRSHKTRISDASR